MIYIYIFTYVNTPSSFFPLNPANIHCSEANAAIIGTSSAKAVFFLQYSKINIKGYAL